MQNVTVRLILMGALAVFSLMIVVGAAVGVYSLSSANQSTQLVYQASAGSTAINDTYKETTRTRTALARAYNAVKEGYPEIKKSSVVSAQKSFELTLKAVQAFKQSADYTGQNAETKATLIADVESLSTSLNAALKALVENDFDLYATINTKELMPRDEKFSASVEKYQAQVKALADQTFDERSKNYRQVIWLVGAGLVAVLVIIVAMHLMLRAVVLAPLNRVVEMLDQVATGDLTVQIEAAGSNEIGRLFAGLQRMQQSLLRTVSEVRTGAEIINTGAQEIAAGNMDLSSRTETQASSLQETAASMEELTGTVRQNAENALQANRLVQEASSTAVKGGAVMEQMVGTMSAINASSRKIVDIISVIDGIAFQTNILALNAAVEAARAGEQGRGFAVVASEVRSLAQRSAAAAKEIKQLIDDSVVKVDSGGKLVAQAGLTMNEVVDSVQRVTAIVSEIAEASREQSTGIGQINQAISQMDEVTQQNAALVEQAAAATQSLQTQATALATTVSTFKIDATQDAAPDAIAPATALPAVAAPRPGNTPLAAARSTRLSAARAPAARPALAGAAADKKPARSGPPTPAQPPGQGKPAPQAKADEWEEF